MTIFIPIFTLKGRRYRCRLRTLNVFAFGKRVDHFPQGDVWRLYLPGIMLTIMIDAPL